MVVMAAMVITTGTNTPETLSATLAMGALVAAASLTMRMIWDRVVSSPTRVARQRIKPDWLMVAADTLSPCTLSAGMLSPVRADSFTAVLPSRMTPSTGMLSPGRTTKISPCCTCSMGTVTSAPLHTRVAVFGARFIRLRRASVVLPLLWASKVLPTVISAKIMAADSKYMPWSSCMAFSVSTVIWYRSARLYRKDAEEPSATSVSMFGAR